MRAGSRWSKVLAFLLAVAAGVALERLTYDRGDGSAADRSKAERELGASRGELAASAKQVAEENLAGHSTFDRYEAVLTLLENATDSDEMYRIFTACLPSTQLRYLVAEHWAELDAPGMYRRLLDEGGGEFRYNGRVLFKVWARSDPAAALRAVSHLGNIDGSPEYRSFMAAAYRGWMSADPEAALRSGFPGMGMDAMPLGEGAWAWIADDPDRAMDLLMNTPASPPRTEGLNEFARVLAKQDPAIALQRIEALPQAARSGMVRNIVDEWAQQDFGAALAWVDENTYGSLRTELMGGFYSKRIDVDPAAAVALLDELTGRSVRKQVAAQIATAWARKDPRAAIVWAQAQDDATLADSVKRTWIQQDPVHVAKWILETGVDTNDPRENTVWRVAMAYAQKDYVGAISWAAQLAEEKRGGALAAIARSTGYRSIALLREHLDQVPPGRPRGDLLTTMGTFFSAADPGAAENWIKSLSEADQVAARRRLKWE